MTDDRVKTLPVLTTVLLSLMPHARAQQSALECPVAQAAGALDAIKETPSQIGELAQILGSGDLGNRIPVFLHALHDRNPNVRSPSW